MAELYPSIIPVKPDVDMVVTPAQLEVAAGRESGIAVTPDTVFAFPIITLTQPLNRSPVLQLSLEYSLNTTAGNPLQYSIYTSPVLDPTEATQSSRDIDITAAGNWTTGTVYFTLFKDVDWDSTTGEIHMGIQGLTATPTTPVFAGSGLGLSYTISAVP